MQHAAPEEITSRARIADGNGDWDFQAVNQEGGPAPRVGPAHDVSGQSFRGVSTLASGAPSFHQARSMTSKSSTKGVDF